MTETTTTRRSYFRCPEYNQRFGRALRAVMASEGMSAADLAAHLAVPTTVVNSILTGKTSATAECLSDLIVVLPALQTLLPAANPVAINEFEASSVESQRASILEKLVDPSVVTKVFGLLT